MAEQTRLTPAEVHEVLATHLLTDPAALVVDLERSRGSRIVDARTGRRYLDLYTFFASSPLGFNHPALADDPSFVAELGQVALHRHEPQHGAGQHQPEHRTRHGRHLARVLARPVAGVRVARHDGGRDRNRGDQRGGGPRRGPRRWVAPSGRAVR